MSNALTKIRRRILTTRRLPTSTPLSRSLRNWANKTSAISANSQPNPKIEATNHIRATGNPQPGPHHPTITTLPKPSETGHFSPPRFKFHSPHTTGWIQQKHNSSNNAHSLTTHTLTHCVNCCFNLSRDPMSPSLHILPARRAIKLPSVRPLRTSTPHPNHRRLLKIRPPPPSRGPTLAFPKNSGHAPRKRRYTKLPNQIELGRISRAVMALRKPGVRASTDWPAGEGRAISARAPQIPCRDEAVKKLWRRRWRRRRRRRWKIGDEDEDEEETKKRRKERGGHWRKKLVKVAKLRALRAQNPFGY